MNEEKDILNTIIKKAKEVKLSDTERTALFSRVDSFVRQNPILASKSVQNDVTWFSYIFSNYGRAVSFALVVFVVLGGSTSFAAQDTLPGNLLYPVKVSINEGIKSLFVSRANKAAFEASRAVLRLQEAETLAKNGMLSPQAQIQVENNFNAHVSEVQKSIQQYQDSGELKKAFDASSNLELSLKKQEQVLANLKDASNGQDTEQLSVIVNKVQATINASSVTRDQVEQTILDSDQNADDVRAVVETKLSAVKMLVQNLNKEAENSGQVTTDVQAKMIAPVSMTTKKAASATVSTTTVEQQDISSRLEQTTVLTAEGEDKLKKGSYKEAHVLFTKAYDVARDANILKDLKNISDIKTDDL